MQTIHVGMAQMAIARSPDQLMTQALGSCVGVVLYDSRHKIGGMVHAMLPDVNDAKESSRGNLAKFVNTAVEELLNLMIKDGARKELIDAKLAGGSNMFPSISKPGTLHVGRRNAEAAKKQLEALKIRIIAEDTGGSVGRTIILDTTTGILKVKTAAYGEKEI